MDVLPHYMLVCYTFGGEWDKENVKQNLKTIGISGLTDVGVQRNLLEGLLWIFFFFLQERRKPLGNKDDTNAGRRLVH